MKAALNKKNARRTDMKHRFRRVINLLHAYVYGRWTREYVTLLRNYIIPRLSLRRKRKLADNFHCKVLTHDHARAIITVDRDISARDLEQIIPYSAARNLVLEAPPVIVVYECACRHSRKNSCQPTQVCMVIGRSMGNFILKYHPDSSRRISQTEALELLQAEYERGHLHSAWFKDAMGGRFYAICNCCKCCCFGIDVMNTRGVPIVASSGYVARVEEARCSACTTCQSACPFEAIEIHESARVNWEACMGCGVCVGQCPHEALSLLQDERKGIPLDVRLLT
jgi:Pyruvate/2-oxoacid:ferredoxin oxidoreductase delta subunit